MSSSRLSSRMAKKQQQQMLRQTVSIIIAAVVLVVAFIFVILPMSIRIFFALTNGTQQALTALPSLPPQVPVFSAPIDATPSAKVALNGFAQPKTEVVLLVNGEQQSRTKIGDDGTFTFDATLDEGENRIAAYAVDDNQQESAVSQTYIITRDTQPPKLEVTQPTDGQTIELRKNQSTPVSGSTDPAAHMTLNGRLLFARDDGSFSTTYQLSEGENILNFMAQDPAGNKTTKSLKVTFQP